MANQLFDHWKEFADTFLRGAPTIQKVEMQKAFFFGAATLIQILGSLPDDLTEEQGAAVIEDLHQECKSYLESVEADYTRKRGRGFGKGGDR